MPYDLFWRGPINAFFIYAEKARLEAETERNKEFDRVWLYGKYFGAAMADVYKIFNPWAKADSPSYPYPKEPYRPPRELTPAEKEERRQIIEKMKAVNEKLEKVKSHGGSDH